jgi:hypothetical protein
LKIVKMAAFFLFLKKSVFYKTKIFFVNRKEYQTKVRMSEKKCVTPQFFFGDLKALAYYAEIRLCDIIRHDLIYIIINDKGKLSER